MILLSLAEDSILLLIIIIYNDALPTLMYDVGR